MRLAGRIRKELRVKEVDLYPRQRIRIKPGLVSWFGILEDGRGISSIFTMTQCLLADQWILGVDEANDFVIEIEDKGVR